MLCYTRACLCSGNLLQRLVGGGWGDLYHFPLPKIIPVALLSSAKSYLCPQGVSTVNLWDASYFARDSFVVDTFPICFGKMKLFDGFSNDHLKKNSNVSDKSFLWYPADCSCFPMQC